MSKLAIFLDRDGVINKTMVVNGKSYPPQSLEEFELIEGVKEACEALKKAGFLIIIVTNQPDVATGKQQRSVVEQFHQYLSETIQLDDIYVCYHVEADQCRCRKPLPGMLEAAAEKYQIDLSRSYLVGDRWKDIDAGNAVGCKTFFIDYHYLEKNPKNANHFVRDLLEASEQILLE